MRRSGFVIILIIGVLVVAGPVGAQGGGRYYPETGHTLDSLFVDYFDAHGGLEVLGYPITDSFIDPLSGQLVQYLQNTRLELVREGEGTTVRLPAMGELLGGWANPMEQNESAASSEEGCRYYRESGHSVCYAFLDFYERHGGPPLLGYPISEFTLRNGRLVQYFQGFRLDWYPDEVLGQQVRVAPLGRAHFEMMGYDRSLLRARPPDGMIQYRVVELRPIVSVWKPIVRASDRQQVYVSVTDQNFNPVRGAGVTLIVHFADQERMFIMPPTDQKGVSQLEFDFQGQPPGTNVTMQVWVIYGELLASSRDSFRVWW
jgi:hypothetical protein